MPSKAIYLDDETYKRIETISQLKGISMGSIMTDWIHIEANKFTTEENRPRRCKTDHEYLPIDKKKCLYCDLESVVRIEEKYLCQNHTLQWHLTEGESAQLYCICVTCLWRYFTNEFYQTRIWSP